MEFNGRKLISVLVGLDKLYDNVFFTLIERMISKIVIIDDAKTLLINHECRLERKKWSMKKRTSLAEVKVALNASSMTD